MRAVRYHEHGDADVLELEEIPTPEPGADEVLIEVGAAGINPVDTYFREGSYSPAALPWIPGSDFAGTVEAVGDEVTAFEPGDRVFGTGLGKDIPGTCAEYAVSPADRIATLPDGVSVETGAAIGVPAVTAWRSLIDHAELEPAERCLIHGGSGGVGHAAVQIAAATGADVTTTASPEYHEQLEALGADIVLDYHRDDLEDAVITAGAPDVILDHRLDDYLQFDANVATQGTRVVGIGNTVPEAGFSNVPAARSKELRIHLISMFNTPDLAVVLRRVATLLSSGKLSAEVARTYDLSEVPEAHEAVLSESFFGKLVVTP